MHSNTAPFPSHHSANERTRARRLKTVSADDVIAELHDFGFTDIAKKVATSVKGQSKPAGLLTKPSRFKLLVLLCRVSAKQRQEATPSRIKVEHSSELGG